ncbi:MAG: VWA domain-containing protein [Candidatus Acidiferrales bacterium]
MGDAPGSFGPPRGPGAQITREQVAPRNEQLSRATMGTKHFFSRRSRISAAVRSGVAAATVCLFLLSGSTLFAQASSTAVQQPIQTTADLVKVDASVIDSHGNFVGGLAQDNFHVLDNGVEQPLLVFVPIDAPARILVMIETSPAVYLIHTEHLAAAYALLQGLSQDDQVALASYDEALHVILPFTSNKPALLEALGGLNYNIGMGELNFYDSLSAALDWFTPTAEKRAFVLLTTGLDSSPPGHWSALVQKLRGEDAVIFSVALGGPLRTSPKRKSRVAKGTAESDSGGNGTATAPNNSLSFANADQALRALAAMTGGRAYFPGSEKDFVPIYHEIASALRHQYVLGIAPARDGQFHSLTVTITGPNETMPKHGSKNPDYRVFSREGYLAPAHE